MDPWKPKDVIALVMIGGAFGLRLAGIDHVTEWIIVGVGGSYFGVGWIGQAREAVRQRRNTTTGHKKERHA
mgnify:CR=1 FL=1